MVLQTIAMAMMVAGLVGFFTATSVSIVLIALGRDEAHCWLSVGFGSIVIAFLAAVLGLAASTFGGAA